MPGEKKRGPWAAAVTALCVLTLVSQGPVDGREEGLFGGVQRGEGKPTYITSDRLDAYRAKEMVTFSGHVTAKQDDWVVQSDSLTLYFDRAANAGRSGSKTIEGTGELSRIEARGNVRITQGERVVTGNEAVYYRGEQKAVVTGEPVLREGENVIEGDRVIVYLQEKRGVVEGARERRVSATIYPDDRKEKKK
ncbi:MAG: LptA/OstA family protein [Syntrophales bacterium]